MNYNCYILIYIQQDAELHSLCSNSTMIATGSSYGLTSARCCTVICAPVDGWGYHPKHV